MAWIFSLFLRCGICVNTTTITYGNWPRISSGWTRSKTSSQLYLVHVLCKKIWGKIRRNILEQRVNEAIIAMERETSYHSGKRVHIFFPFSQFEIDFFKGSPLPLPPCFHLLLFDPIFYPNRIKSITFFLPCKYTSTSSAQSIRQSVCCRQIEFQPSAFFSFLFLENLLFFPFLSLSPFS